MLIEWGNMLDRSLNTAPLHAYLRDDGAAVEWRMSRGQIPYDEAVAFMEQRAAQIASNTHRFTPQASRPNRPTCLIQAGFPYSPAAGAASTPITGPASEWPM